MQSGFSWYFFPEIKKILKLRWRIISFECLTARRSGRNCLLSCIPDGKLDVWFYLFLITGLGDSILLVAFISLVFLYNLLTAWIIVPSYYYFW